MKIHTPRILFIDGIDLVMDYVFKSLVVQAYKVSIASRFANLIPTLNPIYSGKKYEYKTKVVPEKVEAPFKWKLKILFWMQLF